MTRAGYCAVCRGPHRRHKRRRYSKAASRKVERALSERKAGTLRSSSGQKVTSRKQAIAIGLSKARRSGARVPGKRRR